MELTVRFLFVAAWAVLGSALWWSSPSAAAAATTTSTGFPGLLVAALSLIGLALHAWLSFGAVISILSTRRWWLAGLSARAANLVVPGWWRRTVCGVLGSAVVSVPLVAGMPAAISAPPLADHSSSWPSSGPSLDGLPYPDRPLGASRPQATASLVVRRGDTLWDIAAAQLGRRAGSANIAAAWPAWYRANREVVGPDPDLILPGTALIPPSHVRPPGGSR